MGAYGIIYHMNQHFLKSGDDMPQEHTIERAVLVGLNADCFSKEETASEASLEELEALLETAGGLCTAKILQNRHTPDARTLIGAGQGRGDPSADPGHGSGHGHF